MFQILFLILNLFLIFYLFFLIIDLLNFLIKKIPALPTSSRAIKSILKILESQKGYDPPTTFQPKPSRPKKIFVDLGCGTAKVLIAIKKQFPEIEVFGYENCLNQFFLAKIRNFFSGGKIKVLYKDLFEADLRKANIIYCYLSPNLMAKLEKKFERELKNTTMIIANTFPLPNWKPDEIIITNKKNPNFEKIFIYRLQPTHHPSSPSHPKNVKF